MNAFVAKIAGPLAVFLAAAALRVTYFSGAILGDDAEELHILLAFVSGDVEYDDHLKYRLPIWLVNKWAFQLFGVYEAVFFLPTVILSSLLPVLGWGIFRAIGYQRQQSTAAALLIAASPFEVLIGGLRANDVFLTFFLVLAFYFMLAFSARPVLQGTTAAAAMWAAFYSKLWAVFGLVPLLVYYLVRLVSAREWKGAAGFVAVSFLLHWLSCLFWIWKMGTAVPFISHLSATYPIMAKDLPELFMAYPRMFLEGLEFGNTLFGIVPLLCAGGLLIKCALSVLGRAGRVDRYDLVIVSTALTFFLLLNFFPNHFRFDHYYSVPRIFRYLAPVSFLLSLFAGKILIDLFSRCALLLRSAVYICIVVMLLAGVENATAPGRCFRELMLRVKETVSAECPPVVVMEIRQAVLFRELHLKDSCPTTRVAALYVSAHAGESRSWFDAVGPKLPAGSLLVLGYPDYTYYACHNCGHLYDDSFSKSHPDWKLVDEGGRFRFSEKAGPLQIRRKEGGSPSASEIPRQSELPPKTVVFPGANDLNPGIIDGVGKRLTELLYKIPRRTGCVMPN